MYQVNLGRQVIDLNDNNDDDDDDDYGLISAIVLFTWPEFQILH